LRGECGTQYREPSSSAILSPTYAKFSTVRNGLHRSPVVWQTRHASKLFTELSDKETSSKVLGYNDFFKPLQYSLSPKSFYAFSELVLR
jgi:hypothetical protein